MTGLRSSGDLNQTTAAKPVPFVRIWYSNKIGTVVSSYPEPGMDQVRSHTVPHVTSP